ncbi:MAG: ORF6N domain-containing protein [Bacilli bacterium]|nr:ORF6N domain-containing protein [Bacilli bacterium]
MAKLYQCKNGTKEINQAVKNNLEKFPERYSWTLTDEEWLNLRSKILTSFNQ